MRGLANKVTLVAGAGSGIGAATATRLGAEGASVVVADLDAANAEAVASAIDGAGGTALAFEFDISDEGSVDHLVSQVLQTFGRLDGVHVNAADLSPANLGQDSDADTLPLAVFDRTIAVNLRGHLLVTQRVLPALRDNGGGSIVFTASAAAFSGGSGRTAYAMAKGGLLPLSRHVAHRWGKDRIRSNVVAPGYVLTEGVLDRAKSSDSIFEHALSALPSHRLGQPSDIAAAVAFLLSDDAEWITGQILSVDGGTTMR